MRSDLVIFRTVSQEDLVLDAVRAVFAMSFAAFAMAFAAYVPAAVMVSVSDGFLRHAHEPVVVVMGHKGHRQQRKHRDGDEKGVCILFLQTEKFSSVPEGPAVLRGTTKNGPRISPESALNCHLLPNRASTRMRPTFLFYFDSPVARDFFHNLFLRQLDFQHAVLHLRGYLLGVDRLRESETLAE